MSNRKRRNGQAVRKAKRIYCPSTESVREYEQEMRNRFNRVSWMNRLESSYGPDRAA